MISYAWRKVFGADEERELREMLAEAVEADAEAGFPAVSLDQPYRDDASHLVVRLLPDGRPGHDASAVVAAYLRVEPDPGGGCVSGPVATIPPPSAWPAGSGTSACGRGGASGNCSRRCGLAACPPARTSGPGRRPTRPNTPPWPRCGTGGPAGKSSRAALRC